MEFQLQIGSLVQLISEGVPMTVVGIGEGVVRVAISNQSIGVQMIDLPTSAIKPFIVRS